MPDDLIPINDEQAKAIQEAAKTATKALELTEKAGAYVGSVLGTVPADLIAVLGGDWLGQVRIETLRVIRTERRKSCVLAASPRLRL